MREISRLSFTLAHPGWSEEPLRSFMLAAAANTALLCLLFATGPAALKPAGVLAFSAFLAATGLVVALMRLHYPHRRAGLCNAVTHMRLALVAPLAAAAAAPQAAAEPAIAWMLFGVALICLVLDGADGWLARREGLSSSFGARFDVEVDAALALTLALLAWRTGAAGPWVLALGLPRYAFVLAQIPAPWLRAPLPERRARKTVCVMQIGALIALLCPAAPDTGAAAFAVLAAGAVLLSFTVDIVWLARRAPA
jgi:phosphatidylglycerophosphate synthase